MKILFIAQAALKKELGGPKVVLELAEAIRALGHEATVVGPEEIVHYLKTNSLLLHADYAKNVSTYLGVVKNQYNVIDVDGNHFYQYPKQTIENTLFVVRSVLLIPHLEYIKWPTPNMALHKVRIIVSNLKNGIIPLRKAINNFYTSLDKADMINVSNHKDLELLSRKGYGKHKVVYIPYGISTEKREILNKVSKIYKQQSNIAFLGTFDYRKGCLDTPKIFSKIKKNIPDAKLILLGSTGLFQDPVKIYKFFPKELRSSITIIPAFKETELADFLRNIKISIFPSYLEGFGFSIIENMAAGIPVIAYNAPGPSSILRDKYLVNSGDWEGIADKVIYYLRNELERQSAIIDMVQDCQKFDWHEIAQNTLDAYHYQLKTRQAPV